MLRNHWHRVLELGVESPEIFTPQFVRYITSTSIDQDGLEAFNSIVSADNKEHFDSIPKLAAHVLNTNCWIDTVTFGAFLKSLGCSTAVVVIDHEIKEPLCVLDELTQNKDVVPICLRGSSLTFGIKELDIQLLTGNIDKQLRRSTTPTTSMTPTPRNRRRRARDTEFCSNVSKKNSKH